MSQPEMEVCKNESREWLDTSVCLDAAVEVVHEPRRWKEAHGAQGEEEDVCRQDGVAVELHRLQGTTHVGTKEVEKQGIQEHEQTCRPANQGGGRKKWGKGVTWQSL